jgi:flagella basal body P-ring formation protein FlgA
MFSLLYVPFAFAEVDSLSQRVSSALLTAVTEQFVEKDLEMKVTHLGIHFSNSCEDPVDVVINFQRKEDFQGPLDVVAKATDIKGVCGRWRFRPTVAIWKELPVMSKSYSAGEEVKVELKRSRYDQIRGSLVSIDQGPWVARRNINKGAFLTQDVVRKMPTNLNGDRVKISVEKGSLSITAEGKLMSDAFKGEKVRVLSFATDTIVEGVLIEEGKVKLGGSR